MIVRSTESGWEIVFQAAHALLAAQIALHLQKLPAVHFWSETLAAIVDHDDLKEAFGHNVYLTELGAPKDFTQFTFTAKERFLEVQRRIESGYRAHRWIGLLAARHAEELYRNAKVSKRLKDLLDLEHQKRQGTLRDLRSSTEALEAAYSVLQWCDRMSLILCQNPLPAMHRRIEIAALANRQRYEMWETEDQAVAVDLWPFESKLFTVHVEVRTIHQLAFESDLELEHCLHDSPVEDRFWTIRHDQSPRQRK